jgi:hypothetical protein
MLSRQWAASVSTSSYLHLGKFNLRVLAQVSTTSFIVLLIHGRCHRVGVIEIAIEHTFEEFLVGGSSRSPAVGVHRAWMIGQGCELLRETSPSYSRTKCPLSLQKLMRGPESAAVKKPHHKIANVCIVSDMRSTIS